MVVDPVEFVQAVFGDIPELRGPVVEWLDWGVQPDSDEELEAALRRSVAEDGSTFALYQTLSVFQAHTQRAIDDGDRERVSRHFLFVDRALSSGDSDVVNAIAVSYLEVLNFMDQRMQRSWAVGELPPRSTALARELQGNLFPG